MFDDMDEVVADYDERIRAARESAGLSQAELGDQLNEKASFIRKLERGESLPPTTFAGSSSVHSTSNCSRAAGATRTRSGPAATPSRG
jgi:putative transcription factor